MIVEAMFEQFVSKSPISVMARAALEHALSAEALDELFDQTAQRGYTKDLLFSTTVDLMSLVVCGKAPQVQAAFKQMHERVPVTLKSVYEKLQRVETGVSARLVRHVAGRCGALIGAMGGGCAGLLDGYRVRILDGNHLAATQKRLKATRGHSAGALPGQSLAVLDPQAMLITDVIPCADAHAQERALVDQVLPLVQPGDLSTEARNFCPVDSRDGVPRRGACFVTRRHGNTTVEAEGEYGPEVETETGWVSERRAWVCRDGARALAVRQVRVRLRQATE